MNLQIPRGGVVMLVLFLASATAIFLYLMDRFGGPSMSFSEPYSLVAGIPDTQGLAKKSDVLVRGVKVGEVQSIDVDGGDRAQVTLAIGDEYAPVRRSATVRVGQKTVLGEAYVDLDPGTRSEPPLADGARLPAAQVLPAVELDEALAALDADGRRSLRGMLRTFGRGARSPETAQRVGATASRLAELTRQLRRLGVALRGQDGDLARLVLDSRTVLGELADREARVNRLVADGSATLGALAAHDASLREGIAEMPRLLAAARRTLGQAQPLLREGRPLLADLERAAEPLDSAFEDLRPVADSARRVLARLPALNRTAIPFLRRARPVVEAARPVARRLTPALGNLITAVRYLEPRRNTLSAWFSNTADMGLNGDEKGSWVRFFIFAEHGTGFGAPGAFRNNAYTTPNDGDDLQPHRPGSYPRLRAAMPE